MKRIPKSLNWMFAIVLLWTLVFAPVGMVRGVHASGAIDSHLLWMDREAHDHDHSGPGNVADDHDDDHDDDHAHAHDRHVSTHSHEDAGKLPSPSLDAPCVALIVIGTLFVPQADEGLIRVLYDRRAPDTGPPRQTHGAGALPLLS